MVISVCGFLPTKSQALSVDAVRFGIHPDKSRLVVELDQDTEFRVFVLDNPYRLVVDLPRYIWNAGNVDRPPRSNVIDLRTGTLNPSISRLVVDLKEPIAIRSAFTLPPNQTNPVRLVVDFLKVTPEENSKAKEKFFGTLNTEEKPTQQITRSNFNVRKIPTDENEILPKATKTPNQTENNIIVPNRKPNQEVTSNSIKPIVKSHIVIDAGHGGQDPGAIGRGGAREKDITLKAAREFKKTLEQTGRYKVSLTRNNDRFIKLHQRVNIARKYKADLFISLHADSLRDPSVRGASIYTLSNKASDAQTARLAARENKADLIGGVDLSHEDKEVANILIDLVRRDTMNQSKFFANKFVSYLPQNGVKALRRPHRYAGFAVLKAPDTPSVLLEMGFMSNRADMSLLQQPSYRQKLGNALLQSIDAYFEKVRKNQIE